MLNIRYITHARMPTEKAHGYQIAKMCEAYLNLGVALELIVPLRQNPIIKSIREYYDLTRDIPIHYLPTKDWLGSHRNLAFWRQSLNRLSFLIKAARLTFSPDTIICTRTPEIAWLFCKRGYRVFFECHQLPSRFPFLFSYAIRHCFGLSVTTNAMKQDFLKFAKLPNDRVLVAPNGIDPTIFADSKINHDQAREALNLSKTDRLALYAGALYGWKGADVLAETLPSLPANTLVYLIGGSDAEQSSFETRYRHPGLHLLPFQPRSKIALWLKAADILVLPNKPINALSERHTSPIKMFEYMASGTPIIASDIPSLREILTDETCVFVKPSDPKLLASSIQKLFDDPQLAERIGSQAAQVASKYTWSHRAEKILNYLEQPTSSATENEPQSEVD